MKIYGSSFSDLFGRQLKERLDLSDMPDERWMYWHFLRAIHYRIFRFRLGGKSPHAIAEEVSNEVLDLHYVTFLPWADALAAEENHLRQMVHAFYPGKSVIRG